MNSISGGWSGTASASSKTQTPTNARPGSTHLRDWVIHDVPDLRIIDDSLWDRVKRRQGAIRDEIVTAREASPHTGAPHAERGKRPSYLFSGLLSCGCCGANYIKISATRYGCSAARNRGTCTNRKTIERKDVERRHVAGSEGQADASGSRAGLHHGISTCAARSRHAGRHGTQNSYAGGSMRCAKRSTIWWTPSRKACSMTA